MRYARRRDVKLAICNDAYGDRDLASVCEHAASCGYRGIELAPFTLAADPSTLTEADLRRAGEVVRAAGLEVVGFHWLLAKPAGLHLTTPDAEVRARTVDFLRHLVRLCAAAGGRLAILGSPQQRSIDPSWSRAEAEARAVAGVRAVCEAADGVDVTLGIEPLAPQYTNFLTTAAEGAAFVEAVDHPRCRLHLDCAAMSSEGRPVAETLRAHGERIVHLHANDAALGGPGSGELEFEPIFEALRDIGYDGWLSVEVFRHPVDEETTARDSARYLRGALR